ncbi:permease [Nocardiopsis sp. EMB25]|uniref:permease n=1 Tax=Nocardiopsis TaxID=2013 RepID=UPI00034CC424|nr:MULTISPECIES: permease [Nocardiopsis]MCY9786612.1 permease [Nocardiopsis sp. EMB25]
MSETWIETIKTFGTIAVELVVLFFAVAFIVALLQRRLGEKRIQLWLAGGKMAAPLKGAVLGALTPFCSCSTLPMLMGMLKVGAPFRAAAAFLIASPLMNPIILGITWILFSWKVMAGYALVVFAGTIVLSLVLEALGMEKYVRRVKVSAEGHSDAPWQGIKAEARPAWDQAVSFFKPLAIPMLIGVSIGAFIYGAVPQTFLTSVAGPDNLFAVPVAALIGIPLYIRTESALPIGLALNSAGMGLGPVFALIIGGAGASLPELSMLAAIFKPRLVGAYVASILAVAISGGLIIPLLV